jgi:predicted  nucleic acid-binding Zn-ribbon protein
MKRCYTLNDRIEEQEAEMESLRRNAQIKVERAEPLTERLAEVEAHSRALEDALSHAIDHVESRELADHIYDVASAAGADL